MIAPDEAVEEAALRDKSRFHGGHKDVYVYHRNYPSYREREREKEKKSMYMCVCEREREKERERERKRERERERERANEKYVRYGCILHVSS